MKITEKARMIMKTFSLDTNTHKQIASKIYDIPIAIYLENNDISSNQIIDKNWFFEQKYYNKDESFLFVLLILDIENPPESLKPLFCHTNNVYVDHVDVYIYITSSESFNTEEELPHMKDACKKILVDGNEENDPVFSLLLEFITNVICTYVHHPLGLTIDDAVQMIHDALYGKIPLEEIRCFNGAES